METMLFENKPFKQQVRCIVQDDKPWFVAGDIYRNFYLTNPRRVLARLDDDEKSVSKVQTIHGYQSMTMVNESGLYHLLFLINPKMARGKGNVTEDDVQKKIDELKEFRTWITNEVLPSLRSHGTYGAEDLINNPDLMIQILTAYKNVKDQAVAEEEAPFVPDDDHLYGIREAAKLLDITQGQLSNWMFDSGYTERDENDRLVPTIKAADRGLLKLCSYRPHFSKDTEMRFSRITAKGITLFHKELRATGKNRDNLRKSTRSKVAV